MIEIAILVILMIMFAPLAFILGVAIMYQAAKFLFRDFP